MKPDDAPRFGSRKLLAAAIVVALPTACGLNLPDSGPSTSTVNGADPPAEATEDLPTDPGPRGRVSLAFAGDVHFQLHLAGLLDDPVGALGPVTQALQDADLAMVNLESSITSRGVEEPKDYHFRTSPAALDVLDAAGVDVVGMANNHSVDYGPHGLADTLRAAGRSPVPVVGIGRSERGAYAPWQVSVRGTTFAFLAASTKRERTSKAWAAGPGTPGIAEARAPRPARLLSAVRRASGKADVVVVYLHWGTERQACPGDKQVVTARALAEAGADVIVGSHAHVLLGSGWLGETYVNYGLGNFLWYHNHQSETGVLQLTVEDGEVVSDAWRPARIQTFGRPLPLTGQPRADAVEDWRALRGCTDLARHPG